MDSPAIPPIVEILVSSDTLLQDIWRLADLTQINTGTIHSLKLKKQSGVYTPRECVSEIIKGWVSLNGSRATVGCLAALLREMKCIGIAEQLEDRFPLDQSLYLTSSPFTNAFQEKLWWTSITPGYSNCDVPYFYFSGRETELKKLKKFFEAPEECNIILITGIAGIGKTELTRKFCTKIYKQKGKMINCLFFHSENEATLKSQLAKTAVSLSLPPHSECGQLFKGIIGKLQQYSVIVLFDNVDLVNSDVENILNNYFGKEGVVFIVTSRNKTMLQEFSPNSIDLDKLSLPAAIQCIALPLKLNLKSNEVKENITTLCEKIQCHSLVLRQAVAYVQRQRKIGALGEDFGVSDLLQLLNSLESIIELVGMEKFDYKYKSSTLKAICCTLDHISTVKNGKEALKLLRFISYIPPTNINVKDLHNLNTYYLRLSNVVDCYLEILKTFCLVKSPSRRVISVNRIVQEVCKHHYNDSILQDAEALFNVNYVLSEYGESVATDGRNKKLFASRWCPLQWEWKEQIILTILKECRSGGFSNFLERYWQSFLSDFSEDIIGDSGFNWNWIFRFLHYPDRCEKELVLEALWQNFFPVNFDISGEQRCVAPIGDTAFMLGRCLRIISEFLELKGEYKKGLRWLPKWRLLRKHLSSKTDTKSHLFFTPFPIYFRALFKSGENVEAINLFNEEWDYWRGENWWAGFLEILLMGFDENDKCRRFVLKHVRERLRLDLTTNRNLYNESKHLIFVQRLAYEFQELHNCPSSAFLPYFNGKEVFCRNENKLSLESLCEVEDNQIVTPEVEVIVLKLVTRP